MEATLIILAGGSGSRMGMPKGWLTVHGKPVLAYLLERLGWEGRKLLVTSPGREHPPGWEAFDMEVVDERADEGPLRGLVTALENCGNEVAVVVTCDMPLVESRQLRWLLDRLAEQPDALGLMIGRGSAEEMQVEPFPCALRRGAIGLLRERLVSMDRSIYSLSELPQFGVLSLPADWPAGVWTNLNYPQDLAAFERSV